MEILRKAVMRKTCEVHWFCYWQVLEYNT